MRIEAAAGTYPRGGPWRSLLVPKKAISSIQSMLMLLLFTVLFLGAITGGLIRLATNGVLFHGTGITGALVSIEVVDSSICLRHSRWPRIWSILYVLNVIYGLLTGRLVSSARRLIWQHSMWSSQVMAIFKLYRRSTISMCLTEML